MDNTVARSLPTSSACRRATAVSLTCATSTSTTSIPAPRPRRSVSWSV